MRGIDIYMVAAMDRNGAIGLNGGLPWDCRTDMRRFIQLTTGKVVLMGRRTADGLPKPLKNRVNLVLTHDRTWAKPGFIPVYNAHDIQVALLLADTKELWVIGGGFLYRKYIAQATTIHLSILDITIENPDTWFPVDYMEANFPNRKVIPSVDPRVNFWVMSRNISTSIPKRANRNVGRAPRAGTACWLLHLCAGRP